jgi:hypothetical protein
MQESALTLDQLRQAYIMRAQALGAQSLQQLSPMSCLEEEKEEEEEEEWESEETPNESMTAARALEIRRAELNRPRTGYEKFKLWIWNSYKTWAFLPLKTLEILSEIFVGPLAALSFLALMLLGGLIGITVGIAIGVIGKIFGIGFMYPFVVTLVAFLFIALAVWLLPIIVYVVAYSVIHCIINFVFGGIGAVVGLLTSFGLLFMDPHPYWEQREAQEILENMDRAPTIFNRFAAALADPVTAVAREVAPDQIEEMRFSDFNPNIAIITDPATGEKKHFTSKTEVIIKASDGNYYLQTEFDMAKGEKIPKLADVTYNSTTDTDIVRPECLKEKFVDGVTTCAITREELFQKNAVRTPYGNYYDRDVLAMHLRTCSFDPLNKKPLTMDYVRDTVGRKLTDDKVVTASATATL